MRVASRPTRLMQVLPVVCGVVILVAVIYVITNLVVDAAYRLVDPRLKTAR